MMKIRNIILTASAVAMLGSCGFFAYTRSRSGGTGTQTAPADNYWIIPPYKESHLRSIKFRRWSFTAGYFYRGPICRFQFWQALFCVGLSLRRAFRSCAFRHCRICPKTWSFPYRTERPHWYALSLAQLSFLSQIIHILYIILTDISIVHLLQNIMISTKKRDIFVKPIQNLFKLPLQTLCVKCYNKLCIYKML